ncbi:MAG: tRNA lysidine(34) synthetase TilS [Cyanobacteria bacterium DS2.3.42]|nr:tRNA lysidine(34) synthetase TilS [Cyanobacteria bacterium DS2.3.42]
MSDLGDMTDLVELVRERLRLSSLLARYAGDFAAEGLFSWDAVKEYLCSVDDDTLGGGACSSDGYVETSGADGEERLLVGVSGGADSLALLLLASLARSREFCVKVTGCHVNHRLRGEESDLDARHCARICEELLGLDFCISVADDKQAESFKARGSEERLREFRYSAFQTQARTASARVVALAHTLNDQVETVMFRAFRGTAAAGLRGIPCIRRHDSILISRPLIDVSRAQVIALLEHLGVEWREDSSNQELHYSRNFIRSQIIPRIESEFPEFSSRIENMRQLIADDEELLKALCLSHISEVEGKSPNRWELAKLEPLPNSLRRRMFAHALRSRGIEVSFDRVDKLVKMTVGNNQFESLDYSNPAARALSLNEKWDVVRRKDHLMFVDKQEKSEIDNGSECTNPIDVRVPGMTIVPALNKVIFVEVMQPTEKLPKRFPSADSFEVLVSLDKIQSPLVIRERQPGDCIQPFGMKETVKLKKYLHTHKSDDEQDAMPDRRRVYVLACDDEVLWVPGVGLSEKLRVTGRPTHEIKLLDIGIGESTFC